MSECVMTLRFANEILPVSHTQNHAGSKAHADMQSILGSLGYKGVPVHLPSLLWDLPGSWGDKVRAALLLAQWRRVLVGAQADDTVVLQHPSMYAIPRFERIVDTALAKGVRIVLFIHDLELSRLLERGGDTSGLNGNIDTVERKLLACSSAIVAHNPHMAHCIVSNFGIDPAIVVSLNIFDYLMPKSAGVPSRIDRHLPLVVAGNLSPQKAGYLYRMPGNLTVNAYGPNFAAEALNMQDEGMSAASSLQNTDSDAARVRDTGSNVKAGQNAVVDATTTQQAGICYKGSFPADELPAHLEGSFGLVWDGESASTCSGIFGRYLRINNPHKTSLYLACGMPVVIWDQAALAPFVVENKVGIAVGSLEETGKRIAALSDAQYSEMRANAAEIARKLRRGWFTRCAMETVEEILKGGRQTAD